MTRTHFPLPLLVAATLLLAFAAAGCSASGGDVVVRDGRHRDHGGLRPAMRDPATPPWTCSRRTTP